MCRKLCFLLFFLYLYKNLLAAKAIEPCDVLFKEEIVKIIDHKNFFLKNNLDEKNLVWRTTNRTYGSHFLKERDYFLSFEDIIHKALQSSFSIQESIEDLYRAKMHIHSRIGGVTPNINISFGEGGFGLDLGKVFTGIFNFLLPSQWLKLANQNTIYKISKKLLLSNILNNILEAKLLFLNQHQNIQEFEIINFYFIHLQIFCEFLEKYGIDTSVLKAKFSSLGTRMASLRGKTKITFDDLAYFITLEKDYQDRTVSKLNIKNIESFPDEVIFSKSFDHLLFDKNLFLDKVVKESLELSVAKEYFKISKLNIGITAFEDSLQTVEKDNIPNTQARFAFRFGYSSIPNILIANSLKRSHKINLKQEYVNTLDKARRSFDLFTNSMGGYAEAKRALKNNRITFNQKIDEIIEEKKEPDSNFYILLESILESEILLNNALHGSLRAKATIERFLLTDKNQYFEYMPKKEKILNIFYKEKSLFNEKEQKRKELSTILIKIRRSSELSQLLEKKYSTRFKKYYLEEEIIKAVSKNLDILKKNKFPYLKSKKFFNTLENYILKYKIKKN